ncbi:MoxR family ATPase [Devosia sp. SD17-2]|uniref:AAA family ATPase n=1 Tax=Devosia sp. SD17-2 TaxID=2976459 RepID=UPI0023D7EE63|nr:MoxR family ATPase [Devosia sp. SD17-2]WEJ31694.1 MoxR family ATPase [Devosia sp. SD17-2]
MTQPYSSFTGMPQDGRPRDYVISRDDALTVDLAIRLGRPLLIEGEAGCGKTRLADAVSRELGLKNAPIIVPVRSSTRANDLFYRFDALRRLQDSNIAMLRDRASHVHNYVTLEPVGRAIVSGEPRVVLIDEVDKADMDFQNDLLFALERFQFVIDEIPAEEAALAKTERDLSPVMSWPGGTRPIVMFTSNREKQLPKPFLRRCIYLELKFPADPNELVEIVTANLRRRRETGEPGAETLGELNNQLVIRAVQSFLAIRKTAEIDSATKKPATAELLDWIHALHFYPDSTDGLDTLTPPFWRLLFRSAEDISRHARHAGRKANPA